MVGVTLETVKSEVGVFHGRPKMRGISPVLAEPLVVEKDMAAVPRVVIM